jgi:hypothetical protein
LLNSLTAVILKIAYAIAYEDFAPASITASNNSAVGFTAQSAMLWRGRSYFYSGSNTNKREKHG